MFQLAAILNSENEFELHKSAIEIALHNSENEFA